MFRWCFGGIWPSRDRGLGLIFPPLPSPRGPDRCDTSLPRSLLRLQFQQLLLEMARAWKNSAGSYNWYDFARTLRAAAALAQDMGLNSERAILERTLTRGELVLRGFMCPALPLGVFTDKLPNSRGLARAQIEQDLKEGQAIEKMLSVGSTTGKAPPTGASRGLGAYGASAPHGYSAFAGLSARPGTPASFAPLAAGVGREVAAAAQSVVLAFPSAAGGTARSKNGKGRQGAGSGGRDSAPLLFPSNRALSAIARFNSIMQEEQQQRQQVEGGPMCYKCSAAGRNPDHDHRVCAFICCSRCRRGGHRGSACLY